MSRPSRVMRGPRLRRVSLALAALAVATLTLAACSQKVHYALNNVSGLLPPLQFQLTDDNGAPVSAQSYRGDVVMLYFGYTHCPDECPTTLATLAQALRGLGPAASKVRVLFVSVDPQRDTSPVLKRYAAYFAPQVIGLTGPDTALNTLAHRYRIAFHRDAPDAYGNYAVEHSSAVFIFDQHGRARLLADSTDGAAAIGSDLRKLLSQG